MPGFFLRSVDLSSLALLFAALLVAWRLWSLEPRTPRSRWLTLFFVGAALFAVFSILSNVRLDRWRYIAIHLQAMSSALSVLALMQYVYRVSDKDANSREGRLALFVASSIFLYIVGRTAYFIIQLSPQGHPTTNTTAVELFIGLGLLWTFVRVFRQARLASIPPLRWAPQFTLLLGAVGLLITINTLLLFDAFAGRDIVDEIISVYAVAIAVILISFNYFLYWDRKNTRGNRLLATALLTLQSIFTVLAILLSLQFEAIPPPDPTFYADATYTFTPRATGGYTLEAGPVAPASLSGQPLQDDPIRIAADFPLAFFGQEYTSLLITRGRILFGDQWVTQKAVHFLQPDIFVLDPSTATDLSPELTIAQIPGQLALTWQTASGQLAQFTLDSQGTIRLTYQGFADLGAHRWGLSAGTGASDLALLLEFPPPSSAVVPADGIFFDRAFINRANIDTWVRPVFFFQLIVSLLAMLTLALVRRRMRSQDQELLSQLLTAQQMRIAAQVAAGASNAAIAKELNIAEATVKYHLTRIFRALDLPDRKSLADWYREKSA